MHNTIVSGALQGKERLKNANNQALHPTQKPLAILKKLIEVSSNPGDIVLDPFMGIGSTAVAAKETGMNPSIEKLMRPITDSCPCCFRLRSHKEHHQSRLRFRQFRHNQTNSFLLKARDPMS